MYDTQGQLLCNPFAVDGSTCQPLRHSFFDDAGNPRLGSDQEILLRDWEAIERDVRVAAITAANEGVLQHHRDPHVSATPGSTLRLHDRPRELVGAGLSPTTDDASDAESEDAPAPVASSAAIAHAAQTRNAGHVGVVAPTRLSEPRPPRVEPASPNPLSAKATSCTELVWRDFIEQIKGGYEAIVSLNAPRLSRVSRGPSPISPDNVRTQAIELRGPIEARSATLLRGLNDRLPSRESCLPSALYISTHDAGTAILNSGPLSASQGPRSVDFIGYGNAVADHAFRSVGLHNLLKKPSAFDINPSVDGYKINVCALAHQPSESAARRQARLLSLDHVCLLISTGLIFADHVWTVPVDPLSILFALGSPAPSDSSIPSTPGRTLLVTPALVQVLHKELGNQFHQLSNHPLDYNTPFDRSTPAGHDLAPLISQLVPEAELSVDPSQARENIKAITDAFKEKMATFPPRTQSEVAFELIKGFYFDSRNPLIVEEGLQMVHKALNKFHLAVPLISVGPVRILHTLQAKFHHTSEIFCKQTCVYSKPKSSECPQTVYSEMCNWVAEVLFNLTLPDAILALQYLTGRTTPRVPSAPEHFSISFGGKLAPRFVVETDAEGSPIVNSNGKPQHRLDAHNQPIPLTGDDGQPLYDTACEYDGPRASACGSGLFIPFPLYVFGKAIFLSTLKSFVTQGDMRMTDMVYERT